MATYQMKIENVSPARAKTNASDGVAAAELLGVGKACGAPQPPIERGHGMCGSGVLARWRR